MLTKKKIILMLGFVLCAVALLFCFSQTALADTGDNDNLDKNDECVGSVEYFASHAQNTECFNNIDELINIVNKHNSGIFNIILYKNLNFEGKTFEINKDNDVTFNIYNHMLSSDIDKSDCMFNVKGNLKINGAKNHEGQIREISSSSSTIKVMEGGSINLSDIIFFEPTKRELCSQDGGCVWFDDVSKNSSFINCKFDHVAAKNGGAIYINDYEEIGPDINLNSCVFYHTFASNKGGAICHDSKYTNLKLKNTNFSYCEADGDGGAIASISNEQYFEFYDCTFDGCHTKGQGGAFYNNSKNTTYKFFNCNIKYCHSNAEGGAITTISDKDHYEFNDTIIDTCSAGNDGGAIYIKSSDSWFVGNETKKQNFIEFNKVGTLKNGCIIKNCNSSKEGGAIYLSGACNCGNINHISCFDFVDNWAIGDGGAISNGGIKNVLDKCYFESNESSHKRGGAICCWACLGGPSENLTLKNCEFYNNHATKFCTLKAQSGFTLNFASDNNIIYYQNNINIDNEVSCNDQSFFKLVKLQ